MAQSVLLTFVLVSGPSEGRSDGLERSVTCRRKLPVLKTTVVTLVCVVRNPRSDSSLIIRYTRQVMILWNTFWNMAIITSQASGIGETRVPIKHNWTITTGLASIMVRKVCVPIRCGKEQLTSNTFD